ncbi:MAG TPA: zinc ribbon domain-containing protein [Spirochaetia bacterium]|nr:zinc ribbon domain-containing protein [Spirochaetia bacterium]
MDEVLFCSGCHRVLSPEYRYCPYCGRGQGEKHAREKDTSFHDALFGPDLTSEESIDGAAPENGSPEELFLRRQSERQERARAAASFEEIVDESLDRVQETVREYTIRRLEELLARLGELETELDTIVSTPDSPSHAEASPEAVATGTGYPAGPTAPSAPPDK